MKEIPFDIFCVFYSVIRARGVKWAVAYFPNDFELIVPLAKVLKYRNEMNVHWKEQYVLFFWIWYLLLCPFDLSSVQESGMDIAQEIYHLAIASFRLNNNVGKMASEVLVRIITRYSLSLWF